MRRMLVLLTILFSTAPVSAEAQWHYPFCGHAWSTIEAPDLERQGLELIRERLQQAVNMVLKDTDRTVDVMVSDCPLYMRMEITLEIVPEQLASIGNVSARQKRWYKLYFTSLLLEELPQNELVHRAVSQACIVRTGIYDARLTPWTDQTDVAVLKCRIEIAERMGDTELARWFRRFLRE
jgi:hypothetical protein